MGQETVRWEDFEAQALPQIEGLYRTALYVVKNETDAQDVVVESFARAYNSLRKGPISPSCRLWLFKIMVNALVNRNLLYPGQSAANNNADEFDRNPAQSPFVHEQQLDDSDRIFLSAITEEDVRKAIEELPDDLRLMIVLSLLEGFSYREISDIASLELEIVKSSLRRGRELIRDRLSITLRARIRAAGGACVEPEVEVEGYFAGVSHIAHDCGDSIV